MKKLVLTVAVAASLVAVSCSTSVKKAEDEGAALKAKIENCSDPDSLKIYVKQAQDYAAKLVKEGKDKDAQAYLDEVAPVVQAKGVAGASVLDRLQTEATDAVEAASDSVKAKADSVKSAVADQAVDVKDAVSEQAGELKDKATDVVNNAASKTGDALSKAGEKIKGLAD